MVESIKELMTCGSLEMLQMCIFVYWGTGSVLATGQKLVEANMKESVSRIVPISFAFGMTIMILVYSFGSRTGGHINPAVTLSLFLSGKVTFIKSVIYIIAQFMGAILGSLLVWGSTNQMSFNDKGKIECILDWKGGLNGTLCVGDPPFDLGINSLSPNINVGNGFCLEFVGTFFLCITVLMTVFHKDNVTNGQPTKAPLVIGTAVLIAHLVLIPFTGCGINPARTFGPAVVAGAKNSKSQAWASSCWIFYIGPFLGATVAAGFFKLIENIKNKADSINLEILKTSLVECVMMCLFVYFGTGSVLSTGNFLGGIYPATAYPGNGTPIINVSDSEYSNIERNQGLIAQILPVSFAFGLTILVLAYDFAHITGANINPAVTLALFFSKQLSWTKALAYIFAQLTGAILGSLLIWASTSELSFTIKGASNPPFNLGANSLSNTLSNGNGFLLEFMATLLLCLCVLFTAVDTRSLASNKEKQAAIAPYAIGYSVFVAHLILVPFTGAGLNPARTFGPAIVVSGAGKANEVFPGSCWIYYIGPIVGAAIASLIFFLVTSFVDEDLEKDESKQNNEAIIDDAPMQADTSQNDNSEAENVISMI